MKSAEKVGIIGLLLFGAGWVDGECSVLISGGKFNNVELGNQFVYCENSECDGCMNEYWPGLMTIFYSINSEACNGVISNFPFSFVVPMGEWSHFSLLYVRKEDLSQTVYSCSQEYSNNNIKCYYQSGGMWNDVKGAYLLGGEIELGSLDIYIDRYDTGIPAESTLDPWGDLAAYVQSANYNFDTGSNWATVFYGALGYYQSLTATEGSGVPAKSGADEEFAKKVIVHAFICWQDPRWDNGSAYYDIISDTGLVGWPFVVDETPSFVYQISNEMSDIFNLPVGTQGSTWGGIKLIYR